MAAFRRECCVMTARDSERHDARGSAIQGLQLQCPRSRRECELYVALVAVVIAEWAAVENGSVEGVAASIGHPNAHAPVTAGRQSCICWLEARGGDGEICVVQVAHFAAATVGAYLATGRRDFKPLFRGAIGEGLCVQRLRPALVHHRGIPLVAGNRLAGKVCRDVSAQRGQWVALGRGSVVVTTEAGDDLGA